MNVDGANLEYFPLTPDHYPLVSSFISDHYLKNNPVCIAARETTLADNETLMSGIKNHLANGLCLGLMDKNKAQMVALLLLCIKTPENWNSIVNVKTETSLQIRLLAELMSAVDLFQGSVRRVIWLYIVCVHPDYCRQGLAGKLTLKALEVGEQQNCQLVFADVTHNATYKICSRVGFKVIKDMDLTEYDKELNLDTASVSGNPSIRLMTKALSQHSTKL